MVDDLADIWPNGVADMIAAVAGIVDFFNILNNFLGEVFSFADRQNQAVRSIPRFILPNTAQWMA
jgi:hypothetical protein